MGMKVAKFGGSSLADAAQFKKVREILFSDADRRIVVPSAPGKRGATDIKVTDLFYQCNRLAASGSDFAEAFDTIRARYREIAQELELTVLVSAQNPSCNPQLLVNAIERYLPELAPDFVKCCRLAMLDTAEEDFR